MAFQLAPINAGRAVAIPLSRREYLAIARARDGIIGLTAIEEAFDLLLQNYLDLENSLLDIALRQLVVRDLSYPAVRKQTLEVVRHLSNFLSTAKLYVDSTPCELSELFGKNHKVFVTVKRKFSAEYDAALGYRFMETLRNTLQHRGGSAIAVAYSAHAAPYGSRSGVHNRVFPVLNIASLRKDDLKSSVRKEVGASGNPELIVHVRNYLDGLARVHYEVRRLTKQARTRWENTLRDAYRRGDLAWPPNELRASDLVAVDSKGAVSESRHIFLAPLDYLAGLERKNLGPLRLAQMYISNASQSSA